MQVSKGNHSYVSYQKKVNQLCLNTITSDLLQGLPNKKGNSRPYIAFSDRSRYRILATTCSKSAPTNE
jgi:hypothetical protein